MVVNKFNSTDDFKTLQNQLIAEADAKSQTPTIIIPAGTCSQASGANDLIRIAKREIMKPGLRGRVKLRITGCHGFCQIEPSVLVEPGRILYPKVDGRKDMARIVKAVAEGEVIEDLLLLDPNNGRRIACQDDYPFYKHQTRTIMARNEKMDPIRILDYIGLGGYSSLAKTLENGDPAWVVEQVKTSGLRGRGGAGFPTGFKWELLAKQPSDRGKYLICNADEGDPGAFMDRSILEGNPHSVIEGMIIAAYGTGSTKGVLYVRAEYPLAIKHLVIALGQARYLGLLGENILGTGFSFDLQIVKGAGAFVCGEETALIHSIEGKTGEPRQRPPFPIQSGIYGRPTAINNVETWANIPVVFEMGADEYAKTGIEKNSGTKIFSLVGKIKNTGLVEVPLGKKIKEVVYDIGGGSVGDAKIKAVQTGGPSGGCIPADMFDLEISYDSLAKVGSIMGSGGMIVMDENTCMVDVARYFMGFLKEESCGKCFTCRDGTQGMHEILDDICTGKGRLEQLGLLKEFAHVVKDTTMCGLGQTASNPVLSTLKYYENEYVEHIEQKKCRAGVCKELVGAPCQDACPVNTEAWRYVAHIQRGEYEEAYKAIRRANPLPSVCSRVCNHPCESRCRLGTTGEKPVAIRMLKRFVTDNIDPKVYRPEKPAEIAGGAAKVAIVGSGPAGLAAAHDLALGGYEVTIFEAEEKPGGMLVCAIPAYRLPRDVLEKEIAAILDLGPQLKTGKALGKDFTVGSLLSEGYKAVFLAMGAHKSRKLGIEGEDAGGILMSIDFLKSYNLRGERKAKGRVGVIGGGNSAIDAARTALRFDGVESVTVLYRRTEKEMPAFAEEIEAAKDEGIEIITLVTPVKVHSTNGKVSGVEFLKNTLGEQDSSGRRRPVPIEGSEHTFELDTLIVAISEQPEADYLSSSDVKISKWGSVEIKDDTLETEMPGVFAGGDVVTGPNTVIEAIADGRKVAVMIDRYLNGEPLKQPGKFRLPDVYLERLGDDQKGSGPAQSKAMDRMIQRHLPIEKRNKSFAEVEGAIAEDDACREAGRCLRCDLEFSQVETEVLAQGEML